jgi:hypothetical protein
LPNETARVESQWRQLNPDRRQERRKAATATGKNVPSLVSLATVPSSLPPPHPPHPPGPADRHDRQFETCSGPGESSVRLSGSRKCVQNVRFFISGGAKREGEKRAGTAIVRSAYAQFPPYVATAIRCSAFRGWVELGWEAGQKETRDLRDIACQILSRYSALAPGFIS